MTRKNLTMSCLSLLLVATTAHAWQPFKSDKYGFQMSIPDSARGAAKELGDGWAGMYWEAGQAKVFALAKRGHKGSRQEIHQAVIKLTGIPGNRWQALDSGSANGFERYEGWLAKSDNKAVIALLGVGPVGSYMFFLESSPQAIMSGQKDLETWLDSIKVF